jgi:hypothetical protein
MVQICPHCKKTVKEEITVCLHCNNILSTENDWIIGKKMYNKRQNKLYLLGFSLILSAFSFGLLKSRGYFVSNWVVDGLFGLECLIGLFIYVIYVRKGEKIVGYPFMH